MSDTPRITGLGGVFYVAADPQATREWYRDKLGVDGAYGPQFAWAEEQKNEWTLELQADCHPD